MVKNIPVVLMSVVIEAIVWLVALTAGILLTTIVLFRTVVQRARAEAMGVGLKHSSNNRPYVNC